MEKMSRDEVAAWLKSIGLGEYSQNFLDYGVDGSMLDDVDDRILEEELHISKTLHRKKLLKEIQRLRGPDGEPAPLGLPHEKWVYSAKHRDGLVIYHMDTKISEKCLFATPVWKSYAGTIKIESLIYIFGGVSQTKADMDQAIELSVNFFERKIYSRILAPMPTARSCPGLAVYKKQQIYAVGGYVGGGEPYPATNVTEIYTPAENKWTIAKPLHEARAQHALCVLSNSLYCFGGSSFWPKSVFSTVMESLSLSSPEAEWQVLVLADPRQVWTPRRSLLAVVRSEKEILLFGGECQGEQSSKAYLVNVETKTINESNPLPTTCYFEYAQPFYVGGDYIYALDTSFNSYICHLKSLRWKVVPGEERFATFIQASNTSYANSADELRLLLEYLRDQPNH